MTVAELQDLHTAAEKSKVSIWCRLAIRAIRIACDLHGVDFGAIVRKELARP